MIVIGIDNGVTGSIAAIDSETKTLLKFCRTPSVRLKDFNIDKDVSICRIDYNKLISIFKEIKSISIPVAYIERPIKNPRLFNAVWSGARSFEATLIALEQADIKYNVIDSKNWQHMYLPNIKGRDKLKEEANKYAITLYPQLNKVSPKDFDSVLIALYGISKL